MMIIEVFINEYGTQICKKGRTLVVKSPTITRELAVRHMTRLFIEPAVRISTDGILLLLQHEVDVIICNRFGRPVGRITPTAFQGPVATRIAQLEFVTSNLTLDLMVKILYAKIYNQKKVLLHFKLQKTEEKLDKLLEKLIFYSKKKNIDFHDKLFAIEGQAAKLYFSELKLILNKTWYQGCRSRRPPKDPFNSFLSYGYGILFSNVETECLNNGLDPYIGLLHVPRSGRRSLVLDLMEPFRPLLVDFIVIKAFKNNQVELEFFEQSNLSTFLTPIGKKFCVNMIQTHIKENPSVLSQHDSLIKQINIFIKQFKKIVCNENVELVLPLWRAKNDSLGSL